MTDASSSPTLADALRAYVDARNTAMMTARRTLNISEMDAKALLFVVDNPGTRATTLRDYLGITGAGVTTLIDRLVSREVVRRDVDEADRRVNRLTATIDIAQEPWCALCRFDEDFKRASSESDASLADQFATFLTGLTATVVGERR
jgi:DNA-binding MarR family transcriptional regulator